MLELASIISAQTQVVNEHLQLQGFDSPSFDLEYVDPPYVPSEVAVAKRAIFEATEELNSIILGPMGFLSIIDVSMIKWHFSIHVLIVA